MKPDLKSMTRKDLDKLKADIDKTLERLKRREMKAALAAAEKAAKQHGFSLADITDDEAPAQPRRKAAKKSVNSGKPRYANPDDTSQTWTGKGRQPDWFKTALTAGKTPDDLAI